jgi:hypothetical protein
MKSNNFNKNNLDSTKGGLNKDVANKPGVGAGTDRQGKNPNINNAGKGAQIPAGGKAGFDVSQKKPLPKDRT